MRPIITERDLSAFAGLADDLSAHAIEASSKLGRQLRLDDLKNDDTLKQYAACALELAAAAIRQQLHDPNIRSKSESAILADGYLARRWKSGQTPDYRYPAKT